MRYLNNRLVAVLLLTILVISSLSYYGNIKSYNLKDLSSLIDSLDLHTDKVQTPLRKGGQFTDNKSPEVIEKHRIENQVNELLKQKVEKELEYEREILRKEKESLADEVKKAKKESQKIQDELAKQKETSVIKVTRFAHVSTEPEYTIKSYSYKLQGEDKDYQYDSKDNGLVVLSMFSNGFGAGRTYEDFFQLLDNLDFPAHKTSISLLIGDADLFKKIDDAVDEMFTLIENTRDLTGFEKPVSKVTLISAPFLESQFKIDRAQRQNAEVQKARRKILSKMRNFLVIHGISNEAYSLFLDADVIEVPKNLVTIFIESKVDIGTIRIDMKNPRSSVSAHPDYDLNSWAGSRRKPTIEEEAKLDTDPNYYFNPGPQAGGAIHFLDLSSNREKYGLTDSLSAKYELSSVGGAVLFVKTIIYNQGILYPPYYAIGTTWDRSEGWDGIETEGLCYQANSNGYKCWGFPNLIGYHTLAV